MSSEPELVAHALRTSWQQGDVTGLRELLNDQVTAVVDGGGLACPVVSTVPGPDALAWYLMGLLAGRVELTVVEQSINGRTGLVIRGGSQVMGVISFDVVDLMIGAMWIVLNPAKLARWNGLGDVAEK